MSIIWFIISGIQSQSEKLKWNEPHHNLNVILWFCDQHVPWAFSCFWFILLDSGLPLCPVCAPGLQATPGVQINFSSKSAGSRDHFLAGELGGGSQRCEGHLLFILYPFLTFWVDYHVDELPAQKIKSNFFVCLFYVNTSFWDTLGFLSLFWFLTGFLERRCREYLAGEAAATFYHLGRSWHCRCVSQWLWPVGECSLEVKLGNQEVSACRWREGDRSSFSYYVWHVWCVSPKGLISYGHCECWEPERLRKHLGRCLLSCEMKTAGDRVAVGVLFAKILHKNPRPFSETVWPSVIAKCHQRRLWPRLLPSLGKLEMGEWRISSRMSVLLWSPGS